MDIYKWYQKRIRYHSGGMKLRRRCLLPGNRYLRFWPCKHLRFCENEDFSGHCWKRWFKKIIILTDSTFIDFLFHVFFQAESFLIQIVIWFWSLKIIRLKSYASKFNFIQFSISLFECSHYKQYEVSFISFPTVYRFWSNVFTKTYSNTGTFLYSFYSIFIFAHTSSITYVI